MIIQKVYYYLFFIQYSVYFWYRLNVLWLFFYNSYYNSLIVKIKFKIQLMQYLNIRYVYTINLYFLYYLTFKKNLFNVFIFKKKFILYWFYFINFFFLKKLIIGWYNNIFLYKNILKVYFKMPLVDIQFGNKYYLFIWKKLLLGVNIKRRHFGQRQKLYTIPLIFSSYYFQYFTTSVQYLYINFRFNMILNKLLVLLLNKDSINFNWLMPINFKLIYNIMSYSQVYLHKYNNFFFYKWLHLLIYFKLMSSLLTLVVPLRTSIVMFYKKYILSAYLVFNNVHLSISIYNKFLFFSMFNNLTIYKLHINIVWIAVLVPKSYYTARIQFYYFYRKLYIYQKPITKYILKYYKLTVYELFKNQEFILKNVILRSQLCFYIDFVELFYSKQFIFLNFIKINSLLIILYPFDVISFVVSISFFLFYQWQILYIDFKFNRFLYYSRFWTLRMHRMLPKQSSFRLPHWVIFYRFFFFEIPIYLEVDFLVLSIVLLNYYYLSLLFYYYFSYKEIPFTVIRNHNWKLLV